MPSKTRFHLMTYLSKELRIPIDGDQTFWQAEVDDVRIRASPWLKQIELAHSKDFDVYGRWPRQTVQNTYPTTLASWESLISDPSLRRSNC